MSRAWQLAPLPAIVLLFVACGGGGEQSGDDVAKKVAAAIQQPGMVFHTVAADGSEVWIDWENEAFRREEPVSGGGKLISIGAGWVETIYNPIDNELVSEDHTLDGPRPRIDHPMIFWLDPLSALALGQDLTVIGRTVSDGREVLALTARSPLLDENQQVTGGYLEGRVELDPQTYFPAAYEGRQVPPAGETPTQGNEGLRRTVYSTAELVPRDSLAAGFFDISNAEAQVKTLDETINGLRQLGLEPFWLGPQYEGERGKLALPGETAGFDFNANAGTASFSYGLIVSVESREIFANDAVIVRLGPAGTDFGPPALDEFAGDLPEQRSEAMARGVPADSYVSFLSPADLGCPEPPCPGGNIPLYTRLVFLVGETVVQIEAKARIDEFGVDYNGYNNLDGVVALAEALQVHE